jgi:hypothetical protein
LFIAYIIAVSHLNHIECLKFSFGIWSVEHILAWRWWLDYMCHFDNFNCSNSSVSIKLHWWCSLDGAFLMRIQLLFISSLNSF